MDQKKLLAQLANARQGIAIPDRVTLNDLNTLFAGIDELLHKAIVAVEGEAATSNQSILTNFFPKDFFPAVPIFIEGIELAPPADGKPFHLMFTLGWEGAPLEVIPDYFALEGIMLSVEVDGKQVKGSLYGTLDIAGIALEAEVDLPSTQVTMSLVNTDSDAVHPSPLALLEKFDTVPHGVGDPGKSKVPKLRELLILVNARAKRFVLHLAMDNLQIGPVTMDVQTELAYTRGDISAAIWADFLIEIAPVQAGDPPVQLLIPLSAKHDGPATGWQFTGGMAMSGVNWFHVIQGIANKFNPKYTLPEALQGKDAELKFIYLSFDTATRAFAFSLSMDFHGFLGVKKPAQPTNEGNSLDASKDNIELRIDVNIAPQQDENGKESYDFTFSGQIVFNVDMTPEVPKGVEAEADHLSMEFDLVFDKSGTGETILAAYRNQGGGAINIGRLIHQLDSNIEDLDFSINIKDAYMVFAKGQSSSLLFGADIGSGINLAELPLVGQMMPKDLKLKLSLQPYFAKGDKKAFTPDKVKEIEELVPGGGLTLPAKIEKPGAGLSVALDLGDTSFRLALAGLLNSVKGGNGKTAPASDGSGTPSVGQSTTVGGDNTKWFDLQKSIGPIHFQRVGIAFDAKARRFGLKLDGALVIAGFSLSLDGLGAAINLPVPQNGHIPDLAPTFSLRGMGLDIRKDPLELGGAFLRVHIDNGIDPAYDEYDGSVVIKFKTFGLSALGSYARVNNHDSLFIYGVLDYPLGGPPFFFVTGLAAGFGYNRRLNIPAVENVGSFPLITEAMNTSESDSSSLTAVLERLHDAVPPSIGEYFFAVGIAATSFELINSFLLLDVSFGNHLEIDIIGLGRATIPPSTANDSEITPIAVAELAIKVSIIPDEGFIGVKAVLTKASFLLSKDCHLTGGFAFYTWVGGEHAGDFVLTIGGYNPIFSVPDHYPTVPRLGFNWRVTEEFHLSGDAYFALTAHALMAGGRLDAVYQSGDIKAWFHAGLDLLLSWQPFYYDVHLFVDLGAQVTLHIFGSHTIKIDLSADVHVWGPDFSGQASIHLFIITFTVSFGSSQPHVDPISWEKFKKAFLPQDDEIGQLTVVGGLIKQVKTTKKISGKESPKTLYVVNPKDFALQFDTPIPVTQTSFDILPPATDKSLTKSKKPPIYQPTPIGINAMGLTTDQFQSDLALTTSSGDQFKVTAIEKRMPAAMWGPAATKGEVAPPGINESRFVEGALSGLTFTPSEGVIVGAGPKINEDALKPSEITLKDAWSYEDRDGFTLTDNDIDLNTHLTLKNVQTARKNLLKNLGPLAPDLDVQLDGSLAETLLEEPEFGELAKT